MAVLCSRTPLLMLCLLLCSCIASEKQTEHSIVQKSIIPKAMDIGPCEVIFVTPTGTGLTGTKSAPANLTYAIQNIFSSTRNTIYMQGGSYTINDKISITKDNMVIEGSYNSVWNKQSSRTTNLQINPPQSSTYKYTYPVDGRQSGHYIGIEAIDRSGFAIKDMRILVLQSGATGQYANAGYSVYGIRLEGCSNYLLSRLEIQTGPASAGANGVAGAAGVNGTAGSPGCDGAADEQTQCGCGAAGGAGGGFVASNPVGGGAKVTSCGNDGRTGNTSSVFRTGGGGGGGGAGGAGDGGTTTPGIGGRGGYGGSYSTVGSCYGYGGTNSGGTRGSLGDGCCSEEGSDGGIGGLGRPGCDGSTNPAIPADYLFAAYFVPGNQAQSGTDGSGGGGGCGGGGGGGETGFCCTDGAGAGGGGGGGGGQGGQGGTGGWGGGGSFPIYLYNNGPGGYLQQLSLGTAAFGSGGLGGAGGARGYGGKGGPGGAGAAGEVGDGGDGGYGGNGGVGGAGQRGANGVSMIIYPNTTSYTSTIDSVTTTIVSNSSRCTNSYITLNDSTNGVSWILASGAALVNDLNETATSFDVNAQSIAVYYTTTGWKDVRRTSFTLGNFVGIFTSRTLPAINAVSNFCQGSNVSLSTTTSPDLPSAIAHEWVVYNTSSTPTASGVMSFFTATVNARIDNPASYNARYRYRTDCCGWSIPIFTRFTVYANTPVTFSGLSSSYCTNNKTSSLTPSISGGIFSGPGVDASSSSFSPANASLGTNTIVYSYTNANGCVSSYSRNTQVNALLFPDITIQGLPVGFCMLDSATVFAVSPQAPNSFLTGAGTTQVNATAYSFNPGTGAGTYNISYNIWDSNSCLNTYTQTVNVIAPGTVTVLGLKNQFCSNEERSQLTTNPPGTLTGPGVVYENSKYYFDPSIAGIGNKSLDFIQTSGSCGANTTLSTLVVDYTRASVNISNRFVCPDVTSVNLNQTGTPLGGIFDGPGVVNNVFFPSFTGPGNWTITYEYTDSNGCSDAASGDLEVVAPITIIFENMDTYYCESVHSFALNITPAGGVLSGPGVTGSAQTGWFFSPFDAGLGSQTLDYAYTEPRTGCIHTGQVVVLVRSLPTIDFNFVDNNDDVVCLFDPNFQELAGEPSGGNFSGPYIIGSSFDTPAAPVGSYNISYRYTDSYGCINTFSKMLYVRDLPSISVVGLAPVFCVTDDPVELVGSPAGGLYSGLGMMNDTFYPSVAGDSVQPHMVTYTYTDAFTCKNQTEIYTNVTKYCTAQLAAFELAPTGLPFVFTVNGTYPEAVVVSVPVNGRLFQVTGDKGLKMIRGEQEIQNGDIVTNGAGLLAFEISEEEAASAGSATFEYYTRTTDKQRGSIHTTVTFNLASFQGQPVDTPSSSDNEQHQDQNTSARGKVGWILLPILVGFVVISVLIVLSIRLVSKAAQLKKVAPPPRSQ